MKRTLFLALITLLMLSALTAYGDTDQMTDNQPSEAAKTQHFFVQLLGTRDNWPHNMTPDEEVVMGKHYTYLVNLMNQGKMLLAGPVMEPIFGLIVLEVSSEAEAKALMDKEPSVVAGVHTYKMAPMVASLVNMRYQRPTGTDRKLEFETTVAAPVADVWKAWTTSEGMSAWLTEAHIELRIHGPFEIYFDPSQEYGLKGAEGCHVLSYVPERMLSFEWNAPPKVPSLRDGNMRNWIVVMFDSVSDSETKLTLTHLGWGEGEDWDANYEYFQNAWPNVMKACQAHFGGE